MASNDVSDSDSENTKQTEEHSLEQDNQDLGASTNDSRPSNKEISLIEYDGFAAPKEIDPVPSSVITQPIQISTSPNETQKIPPEVQPTTTTIPEDKKNDEVEPAPSNNDNSNTNTPEKKQESPVTPTRNSLSLALMTGLTVKEKLEALRQMRRQGK